MKAYFELKVVADSLSTIHYLMELYGERGFDSNGEIQSDNITYWVFMTKNEGLLDE